MSAASLNAARWLFGSAATFNVAVAIALLFLRPSVAPILALDPINGSNIVTINLVAMFVGLFGYAFALAAFDPVRFRPFIPLGAIGKLLAVACVAWSWLMGIIPVTLPVFITADLIYVLLFITFLRHSRTE
jgi:hypothetical protein